METRIERIAREILTKFASLKIDLGSKKKRKEYLKKKMEEFLQKLKKERKIVDFLTMTNGSSPIFLVITIKGGKHIPIALKIAKPKEKTRKHIKIGRRFVKSVALTVNPEKTDKELERDWNEQINKFLN